ncbi:pre-mRNA-splicing factor CWC22 homolog isoform X2 [Lampetra planeri]
MSSKERSRDRDKDHEKENDRSGDRSDDREEGRRSSRAKDDNSSDKTKDKRKERDIKHDESSDSDQSSSTSEDGELDKSRERDIDDDGSKHKDRDGTKDKHKDTHLDKANDGDGTSDQDKNGSNSRGQEGVADRYRKREGGRNRKGDRDHRRERSNDKDEDSDMDVDRGKENSSDKNGSGKRNKDRNEDGDMNEEGDNVRSIERDKGKDRKRHRRGGKEKDGDRERDRDRYRDSGGDSGVDENEMRDGERDRDGEHGVRDRDRDGGRDGGRDRDREKDRGRNRDRERDDERYRDRDRHDDEDRYGERDGFRNKDRDRDRHRDLDDDEGRYRDRDRNRNMIEDEGRYRDGGRDRYRDRGGRDRDVERRKRVKSPTQDEAERGRELGDANAAESVRGRIEPDGEVAGGEEPPTKKKKDEVDPILTRSGGAYIPPARLRMMQEQIADKSSLAYQRMSWEALKKSINGLINKVNVSNIFNIIKELLQENVVRGRGLLSRSMIQAQMASPTFTHVYSALTAIINSKFPQIGELILRRLILNFRKGYRRNDKPLCLSTSKYVAHLVNQNVAHEVLSLEILTLLLERPTDDSVEVAVGFLKECGLKLTEVSPRGINAIFERLRNILHESQIDKRVQYMIEVMFAIRKDGFKDHPVIPEGLDLVEEDDQFTHMLPLEDDYNSEDLLNIFKLDPDFLNNEEKYKAIKKEILDEGSSGEGESGEGEGSDSDDEEEDEEEAEKQKMTILDQTETNLVSFRRTIYLAIQSSLDFEECAHKLLKMELPAGQEKELCNMILDCCAQQRTYEKFFGLLAGRFSLLKKEYMESYEALFREQYEAIHRLETNKLRNVAKLFAHLLFTDSIPWSVLESVVLSEDTTTSSSRIFVKILFQELCEYMGLPRLNTRLKDE